MKRVIVILFVLVFLVPSAVLATENFLGIPVFPGAKVTKKTKGRLEAVVSRSHEQVFDFYKQFLKGLKDVRFREWKTASYIEDDGNRPWHSITISKGGANTTVIVIMKDNWTWIMGTLFLRFIGVFVVLMVLFIALSVSGGIISRIVGPEDQKKDKA